MKKFMNIFAAALVMLAELGCEKSETLPDISSKVITLSAAINNGGTKTSLGSLVNEEYPVLWSEDDAIAVINNGELFKFVVDSEDAGTTQGTFTCTEGEGFDSNKPIQAFYPYEGVTLDGTTIRYTVPATQMCQWNSFGSGAMPMAGYAANAKGVISFDNLFGVLKLQLKSAGDENVNSIEITSSEPISNTSTLTITQSDKSISLTGTDAAAGKVVLDCSQVSGRLNADNAVEFLIALPPGATDLKVVINTTVASYYKEIPSAQKNTLTAGKILKMPELITSNMTPAYVENGVYYGDGIALPKSETKTIIWAPVNCGYDENHRYGLLYQWGRKYGQGYGGPPGDVYEEPKVVFFAYQLESAAEGSSELYRNYFYSGQMTHWLETVNIELLWHIDKTFYDPCPEGWRVPTNEELLSLVNGTKEVGAIDGMKGIYFYGSSKTDDKVFFPAAGYRDYEGYVYCGTNRETETRGTYGCYWSNMIWSSGDNSAFASSLKFDSSRVISEKNYLASGYSVRCVKE